MENNERSEFAQFALEMYTMGKGECPDDVVQWEEIGDLICDLLHLADTYKCDKKQILRSAFTNYSAELIDECMLDPDIHPDLLNIWEQRI